VAETIITYDSIYETLRKEKYEPEIQKLPETFYNDVINYLKEKQAIVETQKSQQSIFSDETVKTERQIQNIKRLLKEIYERRENKIALFSSRSEAQPEISNLLPEEQEFFRSINNNLTLYRKGIMENLLQLRYPKISKPKDIKTEEEEITKLVRFLSPVPKFMGEDLNIYGPFYADDIASLPIKAASVLIKTKRVQEIKK